MVIRQVLAAWDPSVMPVGSVAAWGKDWEDRVIQIGSVFTWRKNTYAYDKDGEQQMSAVARVLIPYRLYTLERVLCTEREV